MQIEGHEITIEGRFLKIAKLAEEWYEDVDDPEGLRRRIVEEKIKADIFTFWQRIPETRPLYGYYLEWEYLAALPIKSYDHWWKRQIKSRTRGLVRKALKKGVVLKTCEYDDKFIQGMTDIFNETPVRQGKPFWHYGKDFNTIKRDFSRYLYRETLIGAFYGDELIGFIMLADAGRFALPGQIISKIKHRDKAPNNALIAKAVEICDEREIPYLIYFYWGDGSLSEFKRRCGFEKTGVPRYYIPITLKGAAALKMNLHHGLKNVLPQDTVSFFKKLRKRWYERKIV